MATADEEFDLAVLGSGGAGLAAAITAAARGLRVVLVEREDTLGGTTAISAGSLWAPNSHYAPGTDSHQNALRYMEATVGNRSPRPLKLAFLRRAPEMLRFLADIDAVAFRPYAHLPDYLPECAGATVTGRALETVAYDGRRLGRNLRLVRPPLPEFTVLGGMMVDRTDVQCLLDARRSFRSLRHAVGIVSRHGVDRLLHGRPTRLVMGNALVARLVAALLRHGVAIRRSASVGALVPEGGSALVIALAGGSTLRARRGVVLATGGFSHDPELRASHLPRPTARYSAVPPGNRGGGVRLGLSLGGQLGGGHASAAFWAPASVRRRADGSTAVFPHFVLDRGKPGVIAVGSDGRRFVNEATSYQLFVQAMYRSPATTIPCHLVCDRAFLRAYGLGMVHPRQRQIEGFVRESYLFEGSSLEALAARIAVDPSGLADSVGRMNRYADAGVDPDFHKGGDAHGRNLGDPGRGPNPCLGRIETPPFYAVRIHPADIGTSTGLVTDEHARVLDADGRPIAGLYAAGNDMHSVMGGVYPGPGATLGPAMTFGYVAGDHAARQTTPAGGRRGRP